MNVFPKNAIDAHCGIFVSTFKSCNIYFRIKPSLYQFTTNNFDNARRRSNEKGWGMNLGIWSN